LWPTPEFRPPKRRDNPGAIQLTRSHTRFSYSEARFRMGCKGLCAGDPWIIVPKGVRIRILWPDPRPASRASNAGTAFILGRGKRRKLTPGSSGQLMAASAVETAADLPELNLFHRQVVASRNRIPLRSEDACLSKRYSMGGSMYLRRSRGAKPPGPSRDDLEMLVANVCGCM